VIPAAVMWNRDRFTRFRDALEAAVTARERIVTVDLQPPDFAWQKGGPVLKFTIEAGYQKLAELEPIFALPDLPAQPYNEGFEGQ
jgi:hypothetical protein